MHRRKKREYAAKDYWQSYSDMMAGLLLVFVLLMSTILLSSTQIFSEQKQEQIKYAAELSKKEEQLDVQGNELDRMKGQLDKQQQTLDEQNRVMDEQQQKLDKIIGVKAEIIEKLSKSFDKSEVSVSVDTKTGAILLDAEILFDYGDTELKDDGRDFLKVFLPMYFDVLLSDEVRPYIAEIIIEGHTDEVGSYLYNLKLSQDRALSVASYCFEDYIDTVNEEKAQILRSIVTANGRSYNDLVYNEDGSINSDASRRVEFKFRLKDEEMIDEMISILNE